MIEIDGFDKASITVSIDLGIYKKRDQFCRFLGAICRSPNLS